MEIRLRWFRNALGVVLGLVVGFIAMSPVALKAIAMLPVISILTPSQNQEVSGYLSFYAAADSEGLASIQFQLDGQNFGSAITAGACMAGWNSTQAADGLHTVQAIGRDEFNNLIVSQPVTFRVNNFVPPPATPPPGPPETPPAPPPGTPPAPPPGAPPAAPPAPPPPMAPPGPPSNTSLNSVAILSPSLNAVVQGIVPVFVTVPAETSEVAVALKSVWGETVTSWVATVSPSASATTLQVNASFAGVPNANYAVVAIAMVNGTAMVSEPVPVRVENTTAAPPTSTPPQTPVPPATQPGTGRAPSRFLGPNAAVANPTSRIGNARPRPQAQAGVSDRAITGGLFTSGGTKQKSTAPAAAPASAPATPKSTSLPAGTIVTFGLGRCTGPDPYAKHATLRGECVSGTWFPRVRKAEPKRPK